MKAMLHIILLVAVVAGLFAVITPATARGDDYWNGYWGWYDTTYRPYVARYNTYYAPGYTTYAPAYGYSGYGPVYGGYSYGPSYGYGVPYGTYYGAPRAGVGVYPGGAAVRVGPARIGWR